MGSNPFYNPLERVLVHSPRSTTRRAVPGAGKSWRLGPIEGPPGTRALTAVRWMNRRGSEATRLAPFQRAGDGWRHRRRSTPMPTRWRSRRDSGRWSSGDEELLEAIIDRDRPGDVDGSDGKPGARYPRRRAVRSRADPGGGTLAEVGAGAAPGSGPRLRTTQRWPPHTLKRRPNTLAPRARAASKPSPYSPRNATTGSAHLPSKWHSADRSRGARGSCWR